MNKWFQRSFLVLVILFYFGAFIAGCQGLNAGDIVRSDIPHEVRNPGQTTIITQDGEEITGIEVGRELPATMTHNESIEQFDIWATEQASIAQKWTKNIRQSARWVGLIDSLALIGIEFGESQVGMLGPLAPIGTLILGWMRKRPQDKTAEEVKEIKAKFLEQMRTEKESSYNEGMRVGQEVASAVLAQLQASGKLPEGFQLPDISIEVSDNNQESNT